ncbi:MAG: GNAT family N-acetyltransferase [Candidatus Nanohaloarchaea archaeon]
MEIREYTEDDREEKEEMHEKTVREVNSRDYSDEKIEAWLTYDPDNAEDDDRPRWVAEENGEIIGFGDYDPESGEITGLYVHPEHQGEGIATELLKKIVSDARERGLKELWCHSTVTAKGFYEKKGFENLGAEMYETGGEELKVFRMEKKL